MRKKVFRLLVTAFIVVLMFSILSVSAETGIYDGVVRFPNEYGDVNNDGSINIMDLVRLKKYTTDYKTDIYYDASDLNYDGNIDASDLVILKNLLFDL